MPNYYPNGKGGYSVYDDDWNLVSEMPGSEPSITITPGREETPFYLRRRQPLPESRREPISLSDYYPRTNEYGPPLEHPDVLVEREMARGPKEWDFDRMRSVPYGRRVPMGVGQYLWQLPYEGSNYSYRPRDPNRFQEGGVVGEPEQIIIDRVPNDPSWEGDFSSTLNPDEAPYYPTQYVTPTEPLLSRAIGGIGEGIGRFIPDMGDQPGVEPVGLPELLYQVFDPATYQHQVGEAVETVRRDPLSKEAFAEYTTGALLAAPFMPAAYRMAREAAGGRFLPTATSERGIMLSPAGGGGGLSSERGAVPGHIWEKWELVQEPMVGKNAAGEIEEVQAAIRKDEAGNYFQWVGSHDIGEPVPGKSNYHAIVKPVENPLAPPEPSAGLPPKDWLDYTSEFHKNLPPEKPSPEPLKPKPLTPEQKATIQEQYDILKNLETPMPKPHWWSQAKWDELTPKEQNLHWKWLIDTGETPPWKVKPEKPLLDPEDDPAYLKSLEQEAKTWNELTPEERAELKLNYGLEYDEASKTWKSVPPEQPPDYPLDIAGNPVTPKPSKIPLWHELSPEGRDRFFEEGGFKDKLDAAMSWDHAAEKHNQDVAKGGGKTSQEQYNQWLKEGELPPEEEVLFQPIDPIDPNQPPLTIDELNQFNDEWEKYLRRWKWEPPPEGFQEGGVVGEPAYEQPTGISQQENYPTMIPEMLYSTSPDPVTVQDRPSLVEASEQIGARWQEGPWLEPEARAQRREQFKKNREIAKQDRYTQYILAEQARAEQGDSEAIERQRQRAREDVYATVHMDIGDQEWELPVFEDWARIYGAHPFNYPPEALDLIENYGRDMLEQGLDPLTGEPLPPEQLP